MSVRSDGEKSTHSMLTEFVTNIQNWAWIGLKTVYEKRFWNFFKPIPFFQ